VHKSTWGWGVGLDLIFYVTMLLYPIELIIKTLFGGKQPKLYVINTVIRVVDRLVIANLEA